MSPGFPNYDADIHRVEPNIDKKKKRCIFCKLRKNRTKSGWDVLTESHCSHCQMPLCVRDSRNCFGVYHTLVHTGVIQPFLKRPDHHSKLMQHKQIPASRHGSSRGSPPCSVRLPPLMPANDSNNFVYFDIVGYLSCLLN